ncbi:MAG: hypothetical protein ACYC7E_07365 [Armatimonadota bacterium]
MVNKTPGINIAAVSPSRFGRGSGGGSGRKQLLTQTGTDGVSQRDATVFFIRLLTAATVLLCLCAAQPSWGAQPVDARRLAHAEELLRQAEREPQQARALARQALAEVPPGTCPHLAQAAETPNRPALAQARGEVTALRRATAQRRAGSANAGRDHAVLREVLARGEFQELKRGKTPLVLQRFAHWLKGQFTALSKQLEKSWQAFLRWLERFMPHWKAPQVNTRWLGALWNSVRYVVFGVLILAILFLLGLILSRVLAGQQVRHAPEGPGKGPAGRRRQEPTLWERSLLQAEELWRQGEQREAMRLLHRACLMLLDTRGVLRFDETRANGEVLRELRRLGRATMQDRLRPIVRGFDRSWYGYLTLTNDEFTGIMEHSRLFRDAVVGES